MSKMFGADMAGEADASQAELRAAALMGQTQGAMVITAAGLGWAMLGLSALGPVPLPTLLAVLVAPGLLLFGATALQRAGRGLPEVSLSPAMRRLFRQAVAGEVAGALLILLAASWMWRPDIIVPLLAVVVGLHFLPLARVYQRPLYIATGIIMCGVGLATLAFVPPLFGAHHVQARRLVSGLGAAATLWESALVMLIQSRAGLLAFLRDRKP